MCGPSQQTRQTQSYSANNYAPWVSNAGQSLYNSASGYASSNPWQAYTGPTSYAPTTAQNTAQSSLTNSLNSLSSLINAGGGTASSVVNSINPNASITSLMDPYVTATLQPTIQAINDAAAQQHQQNGANATMAGAYGGTAQGVTDALTNRYQQQNIANATGQAESNAYNAAQTLKNQQLATLLQAGGQQTSAGTAQGSLNNTASGLLAALGGTEQQLGQSGINTGIAVNSSNQAGQLGQYATLASLLGAIPKDTTQMGSSNTQSTSPNNSGMSLLGSLLGSGISGGGTLGGNFLNSLLNLGSLGNGLWTGGSLAGASIG